MLAARHAPARTFLDRLRASCEGGGVALYRRVDSRHRPRDAGFRRSTVGTNGSTPA